MKHEIKSVFDLAKAVPDEQAAIDHFAAIRWRNGQFCPYCKSKKIYTFSDKRTHKCAECRKRFSIKVGTIFEDTKIPLRKWFMAIWFMSSHKNGVASTQLAKDIDVTQKTAWFMMHRLRHAALTKSFNAPLTGEIEVDETYIGGNAINKHGKRSGTRSGARGKTPVTGAIQHKGHLVTRVLDAALSACIQDFVRKNVSRQATMLATDEHLAYRTIEGFPQHRMVRHSAGQYVSGSAHTNSIESIWALLKRQIFGIRHVVRPKHLHHYLGEMTWRYNRRADGEGSRLNALLENSDGRLTYKGLVA